MPRKPRTCQLCQQLSSASEPLCYAQIGGLTIATFVTLLLVPVLYSIFVLDLKLIRWEEGAPIESLATGKRGPQREREEFIRLDERKLPLFEAETRQVRAHLRKALDSLPHICREAFVLREIHELTMKETAKILRLKSPTLQTRVRRARAMLREMLLALRNPERLGAPGSLSPLSLRYIRDRLTSKRWLPNQRKRIFAFWL
jgi:RNA polymerase sigma factor (sigma-70 family)